MCKMFAITNLENISKNKAKKIVAEFVKNNYETDGFGLTFSDGKEIAVEKYLSPTSYLTKMGNFKFIGNRNIKSKTLMAHLRFSTNYRGLTRVHPYLNGEKTKALIHNGVVDVPFSYESRTGNDTEYLAHEYFTDGKKCLNKMGGWFAFIAMENDGTVTIVKDEHTSLYCAEIPSLKTQIFATSSRDIDRALKILGRPKTKISSVEENSIKTIKFGEYLSNESFYPKKNYSRMSSLVKKSLGLYSTTGDLC